MTVLGHFPWWAGVVFDHESVEVPPSLLATIHGPNQHLVRFFDKNNSWQVVLSTLQCRSNVWFRGWLDLTRVRHLGEDKGTLDVSLKML
jgi:hypothetical protein